MNSKDISFTAMLGALSAIIRVPFAAVPSIQPSTFLIASTGYVFGVKKGFAVGVLTALVSGFFLGFGPWVPFQMLGWGLCGAFFAFLGRSKLPVGALAIISFFWAYVFGLITNLWFILGFGFPLTLQSVVAAQATSFWFDTMHGVGNAVFFFAFGKRVIAIFERFKMRFDSI